jgi:phosphatidylserine/phosphatidylglycerophosphate/cardiolipin synthase-like enzyme
MKIGRKYTIVLFGTIFLYAAIQPQTPPLTAGETPSLLINEVMCHPIDNENTNEWIELYNPSEESIDVSGWMIADEKEVDTITADSDHGDGTTSIPPGGYALLTDKGTTAYETFTVTENTIRLMVDDSTLCGYGLNNKKEKISLMDQEDTVIDAMEWGDDYDDVPGYPAIVPSEGNSLCRSEFTDNDDSSVDFSETIPTPGSENIVISEDDSGDDSEDDSEDGQGDIIESEEDDVESIIYPLLITELYYDTHPNINDEYVRLMNPQNISVDVSRWYLTDEPWNEPEDQPKILFPEHTVIPPFASWYITKNATAFLLETAVMPNFEYGVDSHQLVPQLSTIKTVCLSNTGGLVGLFSASQTLIDVVIFGTTDQYVSCWEGPAINSSGQGIILKRNRVNGIPVDTNTSSDWVHSRIYHIGQSDFPLQTFSSPADVTVFISPDNSYETIIHELRDAQRSIDITMYEFTNPFLFDELLDALTRNVTIRVFMEGAPIGGMDDRERYILTTLASHGALVRFMVSDYDKHVYARYQFTHAKYIIIDNETVIVESANWAKTGIPRDSTFGNREWGVVVRNDDVAIYFSNVFQEDWNPNYRDSYPIEAMHLATLPDFCLDYEVPSGSYHPDFSARTISGPSFITPVLSPDNSEQVILDVIDNATTTIYIQQLYVYTNWEETTSPLVQHLINKSQQNVTIYLILDYNPDYEASIALLNETKQFLESYGIQVKFISSEWSPFTAIHNKGMIVDNMTVLISSINWNEQSLRKNREAGILLKNTDAAAYYASVFLSDWNLEATTVLHLDNQSVDYKYLLLIAVVFGITIALIVRDWRKRKWR